jgi:hypothetical protein
MKRHIANLAGEIVETDEATPVCGESYCDDCGDCLACCSSEPCRASKNGRHRWVAYSDQAIKTMPTVSCST